VRGRLSIRNDPWQPKVDRLAQRNEEFPTERVFSTAENTVHAVKKERLTASNRTKSTQCLFFSVGSALFSAGRETFSLERERVSTRSGPVTEAYLPFSTANIRELMSSGSFPPYLQADSYIEGTNQRGGM
jgi:hypothetical protein